MELSPNKTAHSIPWMGNQIGDDCWLLFNTKLRGAMQIINVSIMMFIVIHCALLVFSNRFGVNLYRAQSISDALYITDMRSVLSPHAFQFTSSSYLSTLEFIQAPHEIAQRKSPTCFSFDEYNNKIMAFAVWHFSMQDKSTNYIGDNL